MSPVGVMNGAELESFLANCKLPLKLGTTDRRGDPVIHPLWYHYENGKFYLITASNSRKLQNAKPGGRVYFCVDTDARPYKGAKGKGVLRFVGDQVQASKIGERILAKYTGRLDDPFAKSIMARLRNGQETILEIDPLYYSVWDDSKSP